MGILLLISVVITVILIFYIIFTRKDYYRLGYVANTHHQSYTGTNGITNPYAYCYLDISYLKGKILKTETIEVDREAYEYYKVDDKIII